MMNLTNPLAFWTQPSSSTGLFAWLIGTLLFGFALLFALTKLPTQARRPLVLGVTFIAGLFWFVLWIWPSPQDRQPDDLPNGAIENVSFWLQDSAGQIANVSNILTAFLLTLGVFSLVRLHATRIAKRQTNWTYSIVLIVSLVSIAVAGYWDWHSGLELQKSDPEKFAAMATDQSLWNAPRYMRDLLFDGLLQGMDAAMFSIIAFYILSAAYRAFRIRSIEATILLASALIVMLSLLGIADTIWTSAVKNLTGGDPASFWNNIQLTEVSGFIRQNMQVPGLRAIDFGIGIGMLAMGLRLWLGLERGGVN